MKYVWNICLKNFCVMLKFGIMTSFGAKWPHFYNFHPKITYLPPNCITLM
eukprot:UN21319